MSACVGTETCFSGDYRIIWWVRCHAGSVEIYTSWFDRERQGFSSHCQGLLSDLAPFKIKQPLIQLFLPLLHEGKWSSQCHWSPSPSLCVPPCAMKHQLWAPLSCRSCGRGSLKSLRFCEEDSALLQAHAVKVPCTWPLREREEQRHTDVI